MLSDSDIIKNIQSQDIELVNSLFEPVINTSTGKEVEPGQLHPHGYDFRSDAVYSWEKGKWIELSNEREYQIEASEFVIVRTYEKVRLSDKIAALIHSKTRHTLLGMSHISTAIHPGWSFNEGKPGPLLIGVTNLSKAPILLRYKDAICRATFFEMSSTPIRSSPSYEQVVHNFETAKHILTRRYDIYTKLKGAFFLIILLFGAGVLLYFTTTYSSKFTSAAIAVVMAAVTVGTNFIQKKYGLLD